MIDEIPWARREIKEIVGINWICVLTSWCFFLLRVSPKCFLLIRFAEVVLRVDDSKRRFSVRGLEGFIFFIITGFFTSDSRELGKRSVPIGKDNKKKSKIKS